MTKTKNMPALLGGGTVSERGQASDVYSPERNCCGLLLLLFFRRAVILAPLRRLLFSASPTSPALAQVFTTPRIQLFPRCVTHLRQTTCSLNKKKAYIQKVYRYV